MLVVVRTVDEDVVSRLFDVYAESMSDLSRDFSSEQEMRSSYREFLEGFVSEDGHLVLVEEDDGAWKSGLRAVSYGGGRWFVEAVETDSAARRQGHGRSSLPPLIICVAASVRSPAEVLVDRLGHGASGRLSGALMPPVALCATRTSGWEARARRLSVPIVATALGPGLR